MSKLRKKSGDKFIIVTIDIYTFVELLLSKMIQNYCCPPKIKRHENSVREAFLERHTDCFSEKQPQVKKSWHQRRRFFFAKDIVPIFFWFFKEGVTVDIVHKGDPYDSRQP